nr:unnamed protein product [Digitaria exilis]
MRVFDPTVSAGHSLRDTGKQHQSLGIRMALAELIVVMASHCYLSGPPAELAVEFLVRHSAITDEDLNDLDTLKNEYFQDKRFEN